MSIIGKVLDKSTQEIFKFASTKYFDAQFIEVKADHITSGAKIIGEIIEKEAINPYIENPTDVKYIKEDDESLTLKSVYIAKVKSLAIISNGIRKDVTFPPSWIQCLRS